MSGQIGDSLGENSIEFILNQTEVETIALSPRTIKTFVSLTSSSKIKYVKNIILTNEFSLYDINYVSRLKDYYKVYSSIDIINNGVEVSIGDAYTKIIRPMVDSAKKYSDSSLTLTVGIDDEKVTLDADKKYLKTSFLSVVGSPDNQYLSYSIEIPNIPKDTVLIDADGNEIKNESEDAAVFKANNLQKGTKFYLKVPVASITESNKKISVKFIGQFDHYVARAFTANNLQSLVGLEKENLAVNNSKDLLINYTAKSEDTALDVSSSTYIIAFLIIVIGVGSIGYVTKKTI